MYNVTTLQCCACRLYSVPCDMYTSCVWDISMIRCFYHKAETVNFFPCGLAVQRGPWPLPSYRGDSRALFVVGPDGPSHYLRIVVIVVLCSWSGRTARPRTQHDCHHDTKVQPEAATAVIELLMIGGETPETCWAVNKRSDNKLKNCRIRLVIYLN
jgi:hypothetical protein